MRLLPMESSAFTMLEMLTRGQLTSKAIYIAAKLRIADYLRDGPKDIEKLAKETSTHPKSYCIEQMMLFYHIVGLK
jgi:hypothetical protein